MVKQLQQIKIKNQKKLGFEKIAVLSTGTLLNTDNKPLLKSTHNFASNGTITINMLNCIKSVTITDLIPPNDEQSINTTDGSSNAYINGIFKNDDKTLPKAVNWIHKIVIQWIEQKNAVTFLAKFPYKLPILSAIDKLSLNLPSILGITIHKVTAKPTTLPSEAKKKIQPEL